MNKKIIGSIIGVIFLIVTVMFMLNLSEKESVNQDRFSGDPIEEVDMNELIVEEETELIELNKDDEIKDKDESVNKDEISNNIKDLNKEVSKELSKLETESKTEEKETPLYKINKNDITKGNKDVKKDSYQPLTIYFNNESIVYENAGKSGASDVINSSEKASTWGGASIFSGTDNQNTHFIGHYNKQFSNINGVNKIIVTDINGTPFTYLTTSIYEVDEYGVGIEDGIDYWDRITSSSGGERIVIQTSTGKKKEKLIIEASIQ